MVRMPVDAVRFESVISDGSVLVSSLELFSSVFSQQVQFFPSVGWSRQQAESFLDTKPPVPRYTEQQCQKPDAKS